MLADRRVRHRPDEDEQVTDADDAASVLRTSRSACPFLRIHFSQRQLAAWLVADMDKLQFVELLLYFSHIIFEHLELQLELQLRLGSQTKTC